MAILERTRTWAVLMLLAGVLALSACGGDASSSGGTDEVALTGQEWDCLPLVKSTDHEVYPGERIVVWAGPSRCGNIYPHPITYRIQVQANAAHYRELGPIHVARDGSFRTTLQVPNWTPPHGGRFNVYLMVDFPFHWCDADCASYGDGFDIYRKSDPRIGPS